MDYLLAILNIEYIFDTFVVMKIDFNLYLQKLGVAIY